MAKQQEPEKKREKTGGRVAGTPNKTTTQLKEAILAAADYAGNTIAKDAKEKNGLVGTERYLQYLAVKEPRAFSTLLGKVLPYQVAHEIPPDTEINWSFQVVKKSDDDTESTNPVH